MNNKYNVGDLVELSPDSRWAGDGKFNPVRTPGEIISYNDIEGYLVFWHGLGSNAAYRDRDLMPATKLAKLLTGVDT
jgi:hypothetical protein